MMGLLLIATILLSLACILFIIFVFVDNETRTKYLAAGGFFVCALFAIICGTVLVQLDQSYSIAHLSPSVKYGLVIGENEKFLSIMSDNGKKRYKFVKPHEVLNVGDIVAITTYDGIVNSYIQNVEAIKKGR